MAYFIQVLCNSFPVDINVEQICAVERQPNVDFVTVRMPNDSYYDLREASIGMLDAAMDSINVGRIREFGVEKWQPLDTTIELSEERS